MSGRRAGIAGTLGLATLALLTATPLLLAAAAVPLAYEARRALSRPPEPELRAERTVADAATPGERPSVRLIVENVGEDPLVDVRVVDGVPEALSAVAGSPRAATSLRPGERVVVEYELLVRRGRYAFEAPVVRVRSLSGADGVDAAVPVEGDDELRCANVVGEFPVPAATLPRAGTRSTEDGGSGVEFHATREYRPGDPTSRIDWRRFARTGDLTTVEFREERAVRAVLVVDARRAARVTPEPGRPTGAELSAYAAERLYDVLERTGVTTDVCVVGLGADRWPAGPGPERSPSAASSPEGVAWVGGTEDRAAARVERLFDAVGDAVRGDDGPATAAVRGGRRTGAAADGGTEEPPASVRRVLARLPRTARIVAFTPLSDRWGVSLTRALTARDRPTTLVAPDVAGETLGGRVVGVEREGRLAAVRATGTGIVDWSREEPIDAALRASLAEAFR